MKISYAILTHNEGNYIETLLNFLVTNKRDLDEIVVVDDYSTDEVTINILENYKNQITLSYRNFDGDHTQKNYLNSLCTGDYILQLDADELISTELIQLLPEFLQLNDMVDVFFMPRINTVDGLTSEWIKEWNWSVNDKGWVNFPDWQMRLYKNNENIKWDGLLHSTITGYTQYSNLPTDELFCIIHAKQLDRQITQNNLYSKIEQNGRKKYKL
jgi:glycosyltransferase involved in cell wall biosynthesis